MKTKLRPFQLEGVRQIYRFKGRALLGDEQGLGKTIQSLYWISKLPGRRPVVIVTPSSVKYNWQAEAHAHFNMQLEVLEGRRPKRVRKVSAPIIVVNYDILASWLPAIPQPEIVIFDEVHYIKNPEAARTKASFALSEGASSVIGLSGTPIPNHLIELWTPLAIINPSIFPSQQRYAWRYTKPKRTPWGWVFRGAKRKRELRKILKKRVLIRRLKKDVAKELPAKVHKVIPFRMTKGAAKEYAFAKRDFIIWLREKSPARAVRAAKAQTLVKIGYLMRLCAELKRRWVIEWLEEFAESNPGKKVVALSMHTEVIEVLHKRFPNSVVINGKVRGRKRQDAVRKFTSNKSVQFLFGNWRAAGVGLNLQASSNFVALDLPWTPGDLLQGQDRVHRIGQQNMVVIHYLMLMDTVEEKLWKALKERIEILEAVLDGGASASDLDVIEVLLKEFADE